MKQREDVRLSVVSVLAVSILLVFVAVVVAQDPVQTGEYDLSWWTVDGGGMTASQGGAYTLGGTIGQPDAAVWSGGGYTLAGGFWGGVTAEYRIYLPLVLRNS